MALGLRMPKNGRLSNHSTVKKDLAEVQGGSNREAVIGSRVLPFKDCNRIVSTAS